MTKAIWNGVVLAESDACHVVEGNYFFSPEAVRHEYLIPSYTHTTCFWKGVASYFDIVVNGEVNRNAVWYYPQTTDEARLIQGYIAFWHGVEVVP